MCYQYDAEFQLGSTVYIKTIQDFKILGPNKKCVFDSVRNKPENSTCPTGNLKTKAICPPQF